MSKERDFLAAIEAQPEDRTVRLIYSDWLTDRDDARGELIHVEEELRTLSIHSDRYWELKPRRAELRRSAKKAWLERLRYTTDYQPVFGEVPNGWKERWRLLREFAERWCDEPMGDVGGPIEKCPTKEDDIDRKLLAAAPPSLREWVGFLRDVDGWGVSSDGLGANESREWRDSGDEVCFLNFDGYRTVFVVRKGPGNADPPVEWSYVRLQSGSFPHLTTFAFQYVLGAWENERIAEKFAVRVKRTKTLTRQLEDAFPVHSEWDGIHVFEQTNLIALLNQDLLFTGGQLDLQVMVREPASLADVPAFIRKFPPSEHSLWLTR
jgi:uncharacterized protein (TIGR02996 family)